LVGGASGVADQAAGHGWSVTISLP
jgi:hypothetical protein